MSRLGMALALVAAAGCTQDIAPTVVGLESFGVTVTNPTPDGLGTAQNPVEFSDITFDLRAIDAQGQTFAQDLDADVFISFAGNKIGKFTDCGDNEDSTPLATIHLTAGMATGNMLHLPKAYGISTLWIQESATATSGQAVGASPPIYFPNPTIPQVQTPLDMTSPTATYCSPFNGKHVIIDHATGMTGKLVVTSVFIDSYVVADNGANFDPMSGMGGFNFMYVYSFGKPPVEIVPGRVFTQNDPLNAAVSGNVSKFVGFTELNFPLQNTTVTIDPTLIPPTYVLQGSDIGTPLKLLRLSAATVQLTGALCMIDTTVADWVKYNQFEINIGNGICDSFSGYSVGLPGKTLGLFNPLKLNMGATGAQRMTVTGMLRNNSGQNAQTPSTTCTVDADCSNPAFTTMSCVGGLCRKGPYNFWQVVPRDITDIVLCGGAGQACCPMPAAKPCDGALACSNTDSQCH